MELRHLRYFVAAAEEMNISRASARLNISQPAVSRQIRDLEEELGVNLFNRKKNGLEITAAGELALTHARELLRKAKGMTQALQAFGNPTLEQLLVGFIPTALPSFLADALRAFNQQSHDVCVQIKEMTPRQQETALRKGEIDLALLGQPCPALKNEFQILPIKKTPLAAVLPDHHLLALRKSINFDELAEDSFITLNEKNFPGRPELMASMGEQAGFSPKIQFKVDNFTEALGLVASGAGVAVLPEDVSQLPHPKVVFVKLKRPTIHLVSSAAWRKDNTSTHLGSLIELLTTSKKP
jgi:DNA-binding transcriptional LysR family regulator